MDQIGVRHVQKHYWLSEKWTKNYGRRSHVESAFSLWKDRAHSGMDRSASHGDTMALRYLYAAIIVAVDANMRMLLRWAKDNTGQGLGALIRSS